MRRCTRARSLGTSFRSGSPGPTHKSAPCIPRCTWRTNIPRRPFHIGRTEHAGIDDPSVARCIGPRLRCNRGKFAVPTPIRKHPTHSRRHLHHRRRSGCCRGRPRRHVRRQVGSSPRFDWSHAATKSRNTVSILSFIRRTFLIPTNPSRVGRSRGIAAMSTHRVRTVVRPRMPPSVGARLCDSSTRTSVLRRTETRRHCRADLFVTPSATDCVE